jgi:RNA polymerase sigma-70 factor (ECF subfamily)
LVRIRDAQDGDAWGQFVELYGPIVYAYGRKRGLQDADAADLVQTALLAVAGEIRRFEYDPRRGLFRAWFLTVVRNHFGKIVSRLGRSPRGSGDTDVLEMLERQPAGERDDEAVWDQEYELQLFRVAAERVRGSFEERSWQAFWRTAVDGQSAADVARELGMTVGAIYTAKCRVLERIKREVGEISAQEGSLSRDL